MGVVGSVADGLRGRVEAIASTVDASLTVRELVCAVYAAGVLDAAAFVASSGSGDIGGVERLRGAVRMLCHPSVSQWGVR